MKYEQLLSAQSDPNYNASSTGTPSRFALQCKEQSCMYTLGYTGIRICSPVVQEFNLHTCFLLF